MKNIKHCLITQGIEAFDIDTVQNANHVPQNGDVAVFEVLSLGKHQTMQTTQENNRRIYPGDYLLATFGTRYASNQFEGYLPTAAQETYDILGQGGIVGVLASSHQKLERVGTTKVRLVGYAVDEKRQVINSRYFTMQKQSFAPKLIQHQKVYLSVGASMDSGKTTTAGYFARGATLSGKRVAYIKLTGTAHCKDRNFVKDLGAVASVDFSQCGYPSTFMCGTEEVLDIYATLLNAVQIQSPEIVVVEIADGLLQKETAALLTHKAFMQQIDGVIMSCPDSLSAVGGLSVLKSFGLKPVLLSGLATASPLMIKEITAITDVPVFGLSDFTDGDKLVQLLGETAAAETQAADLCAA